MAPADSTFLGSPTAIDGYNAYLPLGPQAKNYLGLRSYIHYWYISYWAIDGYHCDHIIKPPTV